MATTHDVVSRKQLTREGKKTFFNEVAHLLFWDVCVGEGKLKH